MKLSTKTHAADALLDVVMGGMNQQGGLRMRVPATSCNEPKHHISDALKSLRLGHDGFRFRHTAQCQERSCAELLGPHRCAIPLRLHLIHGNFELLSQHRVDYGNQTAYDGRTGFAADTNLIRCDGACRQMTQTLTQAFEACLFGQ